MSSEHVETLVVGGGQAGLAMSEHLSGRGVPHLVLERGRIAERWRSERWDSLVANGPAWHDRFADKEFDALLDEAEATLDIEERRSIMAKVETVMQQRGPICQPIWSANIMASDKRVKGFVAHPASFIFGEEIAIEA